MYAKNNTVRNPDFFDIDKIFNKYNTNHNKRFDLYLVKWGFILFCDEKTYPHYKSAFQKKLRFYI